jgi:hypothetical protein
MSKEFVKAALDMTKGGSMESNAIHGLAYELLYVRILSESDWDPIRGLMNSLCYSSGTDTSSRIGED